MSAALAIGSEDDDLEVPGSISDEQLVAPDDDADPEDTGWCIGVGLGADLGMDSMGSTGSGGGGSGAAAAGRGGGAAGGGGGGGGAVPHVEAVPNRCVALEIGCPSHLRSHGHNLHTWPCTTSTWRSSHGCVCHACRVLRYRALSMSEQRHQAAGRMVWRTWPTPEQRAWRAGGTGRGLKVGRAFLGCHPKLLRNSRLNTTGALGTGAILERFEGAGPLGGTGVHGCACGEAAHTSWNEADGAQHLPPSWLHMSMAP